MKKIIVSITILLLLYLLASYLFFKGFVVGYKNNHFIVYSYLCADLCSALDWHKVYYGNVSYDECFAIEGIPKLVGLVSLDENGKPSATGLGGYAGCGPK
ncbi:MAG: hypothetical protein HY507_00020 [Candidatus Zambryskibacteria bacterium]|nr:hypothetical protein [Candidatus Zambryskibacteria bacterium]